MKSTRPRPRHRNPSINSCSCKFSVNFFVGTPVYDQAAGWCPVVALPPCFRHKLFNFWSALVPRQEIFIEFFPQFWYDLIAVTIWSVPQYCFRHSTHDVRGCSVIGIIFTFAPKPRARDCCHLGSALWKQTSRHLAIKYWRLFPVT